MNARHLVSFATLSACVLWLVTVAAAPRPGGVQEGQVREFTVTGDHYAFSPASLTVNKGDVVKVTFTASDIPHSFTIDGYRISKRAGAGESVTFQFRADQPGNYPIYCNLSADPKCKDMKGSLTVR
jgi:nitrosocyanin